MNSKKLLDISWETILKMGAAVLLFYLLYLIRDTLLLIIFSLVISVLFNPAIDFFQRKGVSRILAAGLIFVLIFGFLGFAVYLISIAFIAEIHQSILVFSQYFERISPPLTGLGFGAFENMDVFVNSLETWLTGASENILSALFSVFGGMSAALFIFFLAFFFSIERRPVEEAIKVVFPKKYEDLAQDIWIRSQKKISGWFLSKVLASVFVGLASFLALKLFNIDYALSLSLFAGITNIIPFIGPIFAGAVIMLLVILDDWLKALFILGIFILIQQIEGNILGPILTKKFIGLPPSLVLISLVVGAQLFGFLGMILAIPLAGILFDFLKEFLEKRKTQNATL
jgi:predicted PurR-regulated permease PerM